MKNDFMIATRRALYQLRHAQDLHEGQLARAENRLNAAQLRHAAEVARAEMVEAQGWFELLGIPGVTIPTAAALMQVSETTVSRWVARYNRGLEEERSSLAGGAA
jgi:DNA-directed RNA polymerase specialized sigma24 family protein